MTLFKQERRLSDEAVRHMIIETLNELNLIKLKLQVGVLSYDEARQLATPYLKDINKEAQIIAHKHNRRYKLITFAGFMR